MRKIPFEGDLREQPICLHRMTVFIVINHTKSGAIERSLESEQAMNG